MRFPFESGSAHRSWFVFPIALSLLASACGSADQDIVNGSSGGSFITGAGGGASSAVGSSSTTGGTGGAGGTTQPKLGPPYPVVLAHGFFGFEKFAGLDFETYFFDVKDHLAAEGETMIYTPAVDPFNSSDYRGDQLIERIEDILAKTGHEKVNLIGHSQGGLDSRAVAHKRPDLVASVVTVATPHKGSMVADIALQLVSDPSYQDIINELLKVIGAPLYDEIGNETDVWKSLYLFSEPGSAEFNDKHPDQPDVFYASVTGRTAYHLGGDDCQPDVPQKFITSWNTVEDPADPLLFLFEGILNGSGTNIPNDGLVRVNDARWGIFWGCIPADHLDEVGQLLGDGPGSENQWNHLTFYSELIERIRAQGF